MGKYIFEQATTDDDASLRELMLGNVLPGSISVTFRREPSFFVAASVLGDECHVMKCTDTQTNAIIALASRVKYRAYLNGKTSDIGYYGDLRIAHNHRRGIVLKRGYDYMRALHHSTLLPIYVTLILEGNNHAMQLLTSKRAGLPEYKPLGRFHAPLIRLDHKKPIISLTGVALEKGSAEKIDEIFDFINQCYSTKQFAPVYLASHFKTPRLKDLNAEDFFMARRNGELVGVIAAWDQGNFRQTHVEKYNARYRLIRPFYNTFARIANSKPLTAEGEKIPYFYASHIAIKNDDKDIFRFLLRHLYCEKRKGTWHYFICGLHERNPLCEVLAEYSKFDAGGQLYSVHYDGAEETAIDDRIPHIEIAAL